MDLLIAIAAFVAIAGSSIAWSADSRTERYIS
jgi:hypothetical protein